MNKYFFREFQDDEAGCIGLDLLKEECDTLNLVYKITFWDAVGEFVVNGTTDEIPLILLEEFISKAKNLVPSE